MGRGSVAARARTTFFRRPGRACRRSRLPPIVPGPAHGAASVAARARTALFRRRASPAPALGPFHIRPATDPLRLACAPARCYGSRACLSPARYEPAPACLCPGPLLREPCLPVPGPLRTRSGSPAPARWLLREPCLPSPAHYTGRGAVLPASGARHGGRGACLPRPVATGAGACLSPVRYGAAGLPAPNRRAAARLAAWAATPPVRTGPPRRRQSGCPRVQGSRVRCCRRSRRLRSRCSRCWRSRSGSEFRTA